jgi:hypothetical protein
MNCRQQTFALNCALKANPKLKASLPAVMEKIGTLLGLLKIVEILPHYFLIMNLFIT